MTYTIKKKTEELENIISQYKENIKNAKEFLQMLKDYKRINPTRKIINKHFYENFTKRDNGSWTYYKYEVKPARYDWGGAFEVYIGQKDFYIHKIPTKNVDDILQVTEETIKTWTENMQSYTKQLAKLYELDVEAMQKEVAEIYRKYNIADMHIWSELVKNELSQYDLEKLK